MFQLGTKITQHGDPLQKISIEQLYQMLRRPKTESADFIQQLRALAAIDERQYRELKKQLPYFVCGIFHPSVRRKENFAMIRYFILDLDHLSAAGLETETIKTSLRSDDRVAMYFVSPGGDGLKVLFRLEEDCRDAAMFSAFYKIFARQFGEKHGLLGAIDLQTHDVTRACFLSADPEAYYNPLSELIRMSDYLKNLDFEESVSEIKASERVLQEQARAPVAESPSLDTDILQRIKLRLNPDARPLRTKTYIVPPALDEAMPLIREGLAALEMELRSAEPIQYGRKVQVFAGRHFAQINIFYGARGFSVVKTTKTGSSPELADLATKAIQQILAKD